MPIIDVAEERSREEEERRFFVRVCIWVGLLVIAVSVSLLVGCPQYSVWQKGLAGKAELKQAEWNRQIAIKEAEAELQSAKLKAKSEVERARGVAEANRIIGDSLKDNDAYLRYLWIQGVHTDEHKTVVYVPTEAQLPILEAQRLKEKKQQPKE